MISFASGVYDFVMNIITTQLNSGFFLISSFGDVSNQWVAPFSSVNSTDDVIVPLLPARKNARL